MFCCIGATVFHWWLCLGITTHHDVAVTAGLMVLCPLSVALCAVKLQSLNFCGKSLKVSVDDVRGWQLLVMVLESEPVLALLRHLYSNSCLADSLTVRLVGVQQVFPGISMEKALTEVYLLPVLALVIEEVVEVLDPGVVKFSDLLYQQQVCPGHVFRLFADVMYNDTFIPAKDIYCQVVLTLNLG